MTSSIYIAKTVYGGDGIGRLGDGRVVFVPGAFAGEHVKAEIFEEKRHFARARLVTVEDPSPERRSQEPPPQPGMVYHALSAKGECDAKSSQLAEFFERARIALPGGGVSAKPVAGGGEEDMLHYRNKVTYHFAKRGDGWALGYLAEPAHEVVDLAEDVLARPEINAAMGEVRRSTFALLSQGSPEVRRSVERKETVTVRWTARSGVRWWLGDAPADVVLRESAMGRPFEVPAGGFWQINHAVGEALVKSVVARCTADAGAAADILDLYCGVGVLGISCAVAARGHGTVRLAGVESGRVAVEFARRNAATNGVAANFTANRVGGCFRRLKVGAETTVIVDPPRGGMEKGVAQWLAGCGARRILYVSCDPATMTRDLKVITGAYDVESVEWFNMFPRTARFETLVSLRRRT